MSKNSMFPSCWNYLINYLTCFNFNRTLMGIIILLFVVAQSVFGYAAFNSPKYLSLYISSSRGDDNNDGKSADKPFKTIREAIKKTGKNGLRIRLKCGDLFFENITGLSNCIIESYGKGDKPLLCGFKILKHPDAWEADSEKGVWKLDLSNETDFTGYSLESASDRLYFNNIGCIYDSPNDKVYGHLVKSKGALKSNGDIFTSSLYKKEDVKFRYLYFKYDQNPKVLGNICLSTYNHGISNMNRCVIRNIVIIGFARHGICNINRTQIRNCDVDIIGGSIQIGYKNWVRYGNGIECWISSSSLVCDNTISNCTISRTYDSGSTIQGRGKKLNSPCRIRFTRNKFIYCRQAFEHFLADVDGENVDYIDCTFSDNLCFMMGQNQFNSPEKRDASLLSYDKENKSILISNNMFYGASYYCGKAFGILKKNTVYIYKGDYLNYYHGQKNYPTIYANDEKSIETYRLYTHDNSRIYIIDEKSNFDKKMRKKILEEITYQSIRLKKYCKKINENFTFQ